MSKLTNIPSAPAGTTIVLRHAEILQHEHLPDLKGDINKTMIYVGNLRTAKATDTYIMAGGGKDKEYKPTKTYHGGRYVGEPATERALASAIRCAATCCLAAACPLARSTCCAAVATVEVTGYPGTLTAADIEFHHFHSANAPTAAVKFSSPTLSKVQAMAAGSQRSNMVRDRLSMLLVVQSMLLDARRSVDASVDASRRSSRRPLPAVDASRRSHE